MWEVGEYKVGRKTQKTRFEAKTTLLNLSKAVFDRDQVEDINLTAQDFRKTQQKIEKPVETAHEFESKNELETREESVKTLEQSSKRMTITHLCWLRADLQISLELPVDLTASERDEEHHKFIQGIPIYKKS